MSQKEAEEFLADDQEINHRATVQATAEVTDRLPFPKRGDQTIYLPDGPLDNRIGKFGFQHKQMQCSVMGLYKAQYASTENYRKYGFLRENEIETKLIPVDDDGKSGDEFTLVFSENVGHCADVLANYRYAKGKGVREGDKHISRAFAKLTDEEFKKEISLISSKCREFYEKSFAHHHYSPEFEAHHLSDNTYVTVIDDGNSYHGLVMDVIKDGEEQLYYQVKFDNAQSNDHLKYWHWSHVVPVGTVLNIPTEVEPNGRNKAFFMALSKCYPGEELILRSGDRCMTEAYMTWRNTLIVFNLSRKEQKSSGSWVQFAFPWDVNSFRGKTYFPPKHEPGTERLLYSVPKVKGLLEVQFDRSSRVMTATIDKSTLSKAVSSAVGNAVSMIQKSGTKHPKKNDGGTEKSTPLKKTNAIVLHRDGNATEVSLQTFSESIAESLGKITQSICSEMSNAVANSNRETVNRMLQMEKQVEGINVENRNFLHSTVAECKASRQAYETATRDVRSIQEDVQLLSHKYTESFQKLEEMTTNSNALFERQLELVNSLPTQPSHSTSVEHTVPQRNTSMVDSNVDPFDREDDADEGGRQEETPIDSLFGNMNESDKSDSVSVRAANAAKNRDIFSGEDNPGDGIKGKMQFLLKLGKAVNKEGRDQKAKSPGPPPPSTSDEIVVHWEALEKSWKVASDSFIKTDFGNIHLSTKHAFVYPFHLGDMPKCVKARMVAKLALPKDDLSDTAAISFAAKQAALIFVGTLIDDTKAGEVKQPREIHFNGPLSSSIVKVKHPTVDIDLSLIHRNPEPISSMLAFIRTELIGAPKEKLARGLANAMSAVMGRIRKETFKKQCRKVEKRQRSASDSEYNPTDNESSGKEPSQTKGTPIPPTWTLEEAQKIINEGFGPNCPKVFKKEIILAYADGVVQASWFLEHHKDKWLEAGIGLFLAMFFDVKGRLTEKFAQKIGYTMRQLQELKDE